MAVNHANLQFTIDGHAVIQFSCRCDVDRPYGYEFRWVYETKRLNLRRNVVKYAIH